MQLVLIYEKYLEQQSSHTEYGPHSMLLTVVLLSSTHHGMHCFKVTIHFRFFLDSSQKQIMISVYNVKCRTSPIIAIVI